MRRAPGIAIPPRVALLDELRDDAHRDFARLVGAQGQADGAVEGVDLLLRHTGGKQFPREHGPLRLAADNAQVRKLALLAKDFFQDGPIGAVAHRHAKHECVFHQIADLAVRFINANFFELMNHQWSEPVLISRRALAPVFSSEWLGTGG